MDESYYKILKIVWTTLHCINNIVNYYIITLCKCAGFQNKGELAF